MAGLSSDDQKISAAANSNGRSHVHLSEAELHGIKYVVMYLHHLPASKKNVPLMLPDPITVIKDVRQLVVDHKDDSPDMAVTGKYVLRWTDNDDVDLVKKSRKSIPKVANAAILPVEKLKKDNGKAVSQTGGLPPPVPPKGRPPSIEKAEKNASKKMASGNRRRRVRCKVCEACLGGDCKLCVYCKDMTKYGGPGRMKQTCEKRRCLHPQLPVCAYCSHCRLDGWFNEPKVQGKETERPEEPPQLYECTVCLDIIHPQCAEKTIGPGRINNDLSNSWECAKCAHSGYSTVPSRQQRRNYSGDVAQGIDDDPTAKKMKLTGAESPVTPSNS